MKRTGKANAGGKEAVVKTMARFSLVALFFVILTLGKIMHSSSPTSTTLMNDKKQKQEQKSKLRSEGVDHIQQIKNVSQSAKKQKLQTITEIPLKCEQVQPQTCSVNPNHPPSSSSSSDDNPPSCPDYFRYIHEDLWPWRETGITEETVMSGRFLATFRLVILDGKAYVETYNRPYQTRDIFTQWGILQLLKRYPGKIPDLDLMFDCGDLPAINPGAGPKSPPPAPVFTYAGNASTLDIAFPDWSFWGWPEINIKPWESMLKELEEASKTSEWKDRGVYAYWRGNPEVEWNRRDLLTCNVSKKYDWNARLYVQNWFTETVLGFKHSSLADQCLHRYKIYIEGCSWSVSLKYILACDSTVLLVTPKYYDFFTRGLMPLKHYWPVNIMAKCTSIKHAVDWGNTHLQQAQAIGESGSDFIRNQVKMDYVYDYMFHLLNSYAKLLTYKPTVPKNATLLCPETLACPMKDSKRQFMMDSQVKAPSSSQPCAMPPPYDPAFLHSVVETKQNRIKQVDTWEKKYWEEKYRT